MLGEQAANGATTRLQPVPISQCFQTLPCLGLLRSMFPAAAPASKATLPPLRAPSGPPFPWYPGLKATSSGNHCCCVTNIHRGVTSQGCGLDSDPQDALAPCPRVPNDDTEAPRRTAQLAGLECVLSPRAVGPRHT